MLKKETQSSLFSPFKVRLGKYMLSKLTREELEMLQTGEINADTLAKYKPFIERLFPKDVRNTQTRIKSQGGATQPLIAVIFRGRDPDDADLARVFNKDLTKRKPTWTEYIKNLEDKWSQLPHKDKRKNLSLWSKVAELIFRGANAGNYLTLHEKVDERKAVDFTLDYRTVVERSVEMEKVGLKNLGITELSIKMNSDFDGLIFVGDAKLKQLQNNGLTIEDALETGLITLNDLPTKSEIISAVFQKIYKEIKDIGRLEADDLVLWELYDSKNNITIRQKSYQKFGKLSAKEMAEVIENTLTSNEKIVMDNQTFTFSYVKFSSLGSPHTYSSINNRDKLCLLYAIYLGILHHRFKGKSVDEEKKRNLYGKTKHEYRKPSNDKVEDLDMRKAYVEARQSMDSFFEDEPLSLRLMEKGFEFDYDLVRLIEERLNVSIRIRANTSLEEMEEYSKQGYDKKELSKKLFPLLYPTDLKSQYVSTQDCYIDLLSHDNHLTHIHNVKGLCLTVSNKENYDLCRACETFYSTFAIHRCQYGHLGNRGCNDCLHTHSVEKSEEIYCEKCHRIYYGQKCFENHLIPNPPQYNKSSCELLKNCGKCGHYLFEGHKCGYTKCLKCDDQYPKFEQHYCQIEKVYGDQVKKAVSNLFFTT